jgi:large subunit ribosomal protein L10e
MARIRKFAAYQNIERPYTRVSKFTKKNFVRGGFPNMKIVRFDMGTPGGKFDTVVKLNSENTINVRHNAMESARMTSNRVMEKNIGKAYHLKIKIYPFHVLRENPLAAGAGADRMSTGMKKSFGKPIGAAARVKQGQTLMEIRCNKEHVKLAREALNRAAKKFPCSCKIISS